MERQQVNLIHRQRCQKRQNLRDIVFAEGKPGISGSLGITLIPRYPAGESSPARAAG
jgi:hypothetical protein